MKGRKQRKGNKRTSISGFLVFRENTTRMSLCIWFCMPWMSRGGISTPKSWAFWASWIKSLKAWHLKDHRSCHRLRATMALPVEAHFSAGKQTFLSHTLTLAWPTCHFVVEEWEVVKGANSIQYMESFPWVIPYPMCQTVHYQACWAYEQIWQLIFLRERKSTHSGNGCLIYLYSDDKKSHPNYKCMWLIWKAYVLVKGKKISEDPLLAGSQCVVDQNIFLDYLFSWVNHLNNFCANIWASF